MNRALTILVFLPFAACDCDGLAGGGDGGPGAEGEGEGNDDGGFIGDSGVPLECQDGLTAIALSPATQTVTLDGSTAPALTFTAAGVPGGSALDESALLWTASRGDDGDPGAVEAGLYRPNPALGGTVTITATDGCVSGSATVTLVVDATIGTPVGDPADWEGAPDETGDVPVVVYPSDQTRFPPNIYQTLFQWRAAGYSEFRLTFVGGSSTVTVFTDGLHPQCAEANDAGCFEADALAWALIAGSNAGSTVTWTVDALDRSGATPVVKRGASITIGFSLRAVKGAIFYWSTTSAGIRRANIGDATPEDYITGRPGTQYQVEGQVGCVACHYVSRDGTKIAAPVQASETDKSLWIMDVTLSSPPTPVVTAVADTDGHGFATFSPDNSLVMAAWRGRMWLVDAATGTYLVDVDISALGEGEGTHPDWSPDGAGVAYATAKGDAPGGAAIGFLPQTNADTFAAPEIMVEPDVDGRTDLFPMFSPDARWLAFSRGQGGHGDERMQLFVADAAAARPVTPVELVNANRVVSNALTDGIHQNAAPTWAPPGDMYWIAFNSKRAYGVVDEGGGTQQIWVAAVDPALLEAGNVDPSFPAFRLQFQGLNENNHRAFWTLDVREEEPPVDAGPQPDAGPQADAGFADAGPQVCLPPGNTCDPVLDCCDSGSICETLDDGETYTCILIGG